ncbi:MAG: hypothetical protein EBW12_06995, partial [Actinobacteria bacterium]|nr:hypothetical protein [Actinomycetota bacterium]
MITHPNINQIKTVLEQDTTLVINSGCIFEYNMNTLVDNITMTGAQISRTDAAGNTYQPFKKLFPIDTVIKPNRPLKAGIKYAIVGDVGSGSYRNPKSSQYNIDYRTYYPGAETTYKYYVSDKGVGLDVTATYPKTILTNKIVIRFELAHSTPPTWTIYNGSTQLATGTSADIKAFGQADAGTVVIYYNGTSWSTTEPATPSSPINMTSLRVTAGAVSGKYIGLIEMAPKWVVDTTTKIVGLTISKESSSNADDVLPVGLVSANSLSLNMVSYEEPREMVAFEKTMTFDPTKIYLYKRVEIIPYFKMYYSTASLSDANGNYEKINQGVFYVDNWQIEEFGDVSVTALDGAKILQEMTAPSIVCKEFSTISIMRTLLDNVGFTNYNFNTTSSDKSIFAPRYWWTDDGRTVWEAIQQLCRDSQMVATFDENNILQFYTREFLFNSADPIDWNLRYETSGSNLPNIISFNKQDLSSANQVKVLWNSVTSNEYLGNAQPLWKSSVSDLGALSLEENLPSTRTATTTPNYMTLRAVVQNEGSKGQILDSFSGYVAIDSEIIEYDAV